MRESNVFVGLAVVIVCIFTLALTFTITIGCSPTPEFPTPPDKPSIKLLTYEELTGGITAGVIEVVDTEEQFIFVRSYENSMAIAPLERSQDVSRIGKEQSEGQLGDNRVTGR